VAKSTKKKPTSKTSKTKKTSYLYLEKSSGRFYVSGTARPQFVTSSSNLFRVKLSALESAKVTVNWKG